MLGLSVSNFHASPFGSLRGGGRIAGDLPNGVTKAGAGAAEWVHLGLADRSSGFFRVASTKSAADGSYSFENLSTAKSFVVLAHDSDGNFNSVIRANITPAPMP